MSLITLNNMVSFHFFYSVPAIPSAIMRAPCLHGSTWRMPSHSVVPDYGPASDAGIFREVRKQIEHLGLKVLKSLVGVQRFEAFALVLPLAELAEIPPGCPTLCMMPLPFPHSPPQL